jgi:hypothetical protein
MSRRRAQESAAALVVPVSQAQSCSLQVLVDDTAGSLQDYQY